MQRPLVHRIKVLKDHLSTTFTGVGLTATTTTTITETAKGSKSCSLSRNSTVAQEINIQQPANMALSKLHARLDNSMLRELNVDPQEEEFFPNHLSRGVHSGDFVRIVPTPLKQPYLISYSEDMAARLGLDDADVRSRVFVKCFGADVWSEDSAVHLDSWCTPYAVSVGRHKILSPDPFGGYGYGDGRACSIGEFSAVEQTANDGFKRFELQLKGCGPSPFSRQFDGRAVLRSSIREFLASEAMHFLGVPITRALSLVASAEDTVDRVWYRPDVGPGSQHDYPPDHMVKEKCAITCRAASSFLRVGQVEMYARRIGRSDEGAEAGMKIFLKHCLRREFPSIAAKLTALSTPEEFAAALVEMLREFALRQAFLVTQWMRVGYVQGNMNSDNCLLAGCTMDYGPFGFMEQYERLWNPFTSDPAKNFGFENQPFAARDNLINLVEAVAPFVFKADLKKDFKKEVVKVINEDFVHFLRTESDKVKGAKLGLHNFDFEKHHATLWDPLYEILQDFDYTVFFRELSYLDRNKLNGCESDLALVQLLQRAAYGPLDKDWCPTKTKRFADWLSLYGSMLEEEARPDKERQASMQKANPKYVPREWMLQECYEAAQKGDYAPLEKMKTMLWNPYEEHMEYAEDYYRTTPPQFKKKPGVSFFSCSS